VKLCPEKTMQGKERQGCIPVLQISELPSSPTLLLWGEGSQNSKSLAPRERDLGWGRKAGMHPNASLKVQLPSLFQMIGCNYDSISSRVDSLPLQQFQIQNDFATFQRSVEILRIINPSCCKGFRAVKFWIWNCCCPLGRKYLINRLVDFGLNMATIRI